MTLLHLVPRYCSQYVHTAKYSNVNAAFPTKEFSSEQATILVVLCVHHQWSITAWAFACMCCLQGVLNAFAFWDSLGQPARAMNTPKSHSDSEIVREMRQTRPRLEEPSSSTTSSRPPQMLDGMQQGVMSI